MYKCVRSLSALLSSAMFLGSVSLSSAGTAPSRIDPASIDEKNLVTLPGNTHPLARPEFDRGVAPPDLPLNRMLLLLKRTAAQQTALQQLLAQQQQRTSPLYHNWLTPQQFGDRFGASDGDIHTIVSWLQSHGFRVTNVTRGRTIIEFSGIERQLEAAFHTQVHKFVVNGEEHWANATDPRIPVAFAPVMEGFVSLNDFRPKPQSVIGKQRKAAYTPGPLRPQLTLSDGTHVLTPGDYGVIYNIPQYQQGIDGSGTTIAIVARSNIDVQNIVDFRNLFGLPPTPPQIVVNGPDPGDLGGDDEGEATLDATWAGATAPNSTVDLVVSESTNTTDGIFLSEIYILEQGSANVMSESFSTCEANATQAGALVIQSLAEQAAIEGITYLVSAGDTGSAGCDTQDESEATQPLSVNLLASSSYTVAVGGTEFNENGDDDLYWSSENQNNFASALSYIPENVWNESCLASDCSNPNILAGGGGFSIFFSKPAWQVPLTPSDGWRDVPDVSLTAAGHDPYLLCLQRSCEPDANGNFSFAEVFGTSASAPSFAGIMALVNQVQASRQGNVNPILYFLAGLENFDFCNGSIPGLDQPSCIFNDVTVGSNSVPGEPGYGTSAGSYQAGTGYDLASGLGSVNVTNLISQWPSVLQQVPGALHTVSVGADGTVCGLNASGSIYCYGFGDQIWINVPGALTTIAVGNINAIWGLNAAGAIYHYDLNTQSWVRIPGTLANIAVGSDGDVWGINASGTLYHWLPSIQSWGYFRNLTFQQVAVGYDAAVWAIDTNSNLWRYDAAREIIHKFSSSSSFSQVSVGGDGTAWSVDVNTNLYRFDSLTQNWDLISSGVASVAVGSAYNVWIIDTSGGLDQFSTATQSFVGPIPGSSQSVARISAAANGSMVALDGSNNIYATEFYPSTPGFKRVSAAQVQLTTIAVSPDGNAVGVDSANNGYEFNFAGQNWSYLGVPVLQTSVGFGGNIWSVDVGDSLSYFYPQSSFPQTLTPPGALMQIAGGATFYQNDPNTGFSGYGETWGVNSASQIYRWDQSIQSWDFIPGALSQIFVGADDTVIGINTIGYTYLYDYAQQTWAQIPGVLTQVSVGSLYSIWGLNQYGWIYHYNPKTNQWDQVPGLLQQISAGYDGDVWGVNPAGQIYRYDPITIWDQIPGTLAAVAVGSDGAIWGLDAYGSIYRYSY